MRTLIQDLHYAARTFSKSPGFTAVVIISIALGIAANTTVFSVINGLMLSSAPVGDPDTLFMLNDGNSFSWPNYADYRDQTAGKVFDGVAAFFPLVPASAGGKGEPERIWGQLVTANYFDVIRVRPVIGRGFLPEEDKAEGRNPVVVLGHALWQRRFGGDAGVIGRTVLLNGAPYTVVGVAPAGFSGSIKMIAGEFWTPISNRTQLVPDLGKANLLDQRDNQWLIVNARLKPGVSREQATAALNVVKHRIDETYYKNDTNRRKDTIRLTPCGRMPAVGEMVGLLAVLMVVVGLVLLIACANVANLMLARGAARRKEIGIRLSIGAGRWRLVRQLLTESVFLAVGGAAVGYILAWIAATALSRFELPLPLPIVFDFRPDWRVLAFTAALSVFTGILFGLAPAWRSTKTDLVTCLKDQGSGLGSLRRFGLRNALVVVQVSLSLVLLIGAGLFVRSLQNASRIDIGMKADGVLMMAFDPKLNGYTPERTKQLLMQLRSRVSALPGVQSVSYIDSIPLSIGGTTFGFDVLDAQGGKKSASADVYNVGRDFFAAVGIPFVRGRDFEPRDGYRAAIINERMAEILFGKADPIGQVLRHDDETQEVIAVVKTAKSRTLGEEPHAAVYLPLEGDPAKVMSFYGISIIAKAGGSAGRYTRSIREQLLALDSSLAVTGSETMQEHVDKAMLLPKICAVLLGTFGLVGLALAAVGLYGVLSFVVRSRTREIGIRMALGAGHAGVLAMIARQGLALAAVGVVIGISLSWALTRFAATFLYGIEAHDPLTFVGIPAILLVVTAVAIAGPARRASHVEPTTALRYE